MPEIVAVADGFFLATDGTEYSAGPVAVGQHVASGYPTLNLYPTLAALNLALAAAGHPSYEEPHPHAEPHVYGGQS